jgi:hypothetical protein
LGLLDDRLARGQAAAGEEVRRRAAARAPSPQFEEECDDIDSIRTTPGRVGHIAEEEEAEAEEAEAEEVEPEPEAAAAAADVKLRRGQPAPAAAAPPAPEDAGWAEVEDAGYACEHCDAFVGAYAAVVDHEAAGATRRSRHCFVHRPVCFLWRTTA